jgi:hypothetical protein
MSALEDRRQAAREAGWDVTVGWSQESTAYALDAAVETATRVRITPEIIEAYRDARADLNREQIQGRPPATPDTLTRAGIRAAFAAAGFEVEE